MNAHGTLSMSSGLRSFLLRRSLAAAGVLLVGVVIVVVLLNAGVCAGIDGIIAQIRQEIEAEIIAKKMTFPSLEAREEYISERLQRELQARGLDICS